MSEFSARTDLIARDPGYRRFINARHPFTRLYSAWNDKSRKIFEILLGKFVDRSTGEIA